MWCKAREGRRISASLSTRRRQKKGEGHGCTNKASLIWGYTQKNNHFRSLVAKKKSEGTLPKPIIRALVAKKKPPSAAKKKETATNDANVH